MNDTIDLEYGHRAALPPADPIGIFAHWSSRLI